ncbi:ARM repeat-containing protein [Wilcoxina mikolae CBS 423.85]|nr:ARM repeat-containing protein [Wilcoxina mikolae CBS 423.85]
MPREMRKRGRRAEKKRKTESNTVPEPAAPALENLYVEDVDGAVAVREDDTTFYGLLTEEEQEYFRRADEVLALDQFGDEDEKALFIGNLYQEASGKELKIAHSQGCSRLLERLILLSTPAQLKALFQYFSGHYLALIKHRFASHVCETLFLQAAPLVSKEMDAEYSGKSGAEDISTETVFASMESLFLFMFHEILPELKSLITHTFASHTIRTLLLLLSGRPVSSATTLIQSRKKENIPMNTENVSKEVTDQIAVVPQSFHEAVGKVLAVVNEQFTTEELRMLAVHQIASPALQIMLQLEMGLSKKERRIKEKAGGTLLGKLTGVTQKDEAVATKEEEEGENADKKDADVERSFFQNLLYDPVGSHLAESMMRAAPKKDFNMLYKRFIKPRLGSLARNETAAFVVQRVLEKLPKEGLEEAIKEILPQVPGLVERSRVAVLKSLIDACIKHSVDATPIITAIISSYSCSPPELIFKILRLSSTDLLPSDDDKPKHINAPSKPKRDPSQLHGALLAQTILDLPAEASAPFTNSLLSQPADTLVALCKHQQASHVVQKILNSPQASMPNKRKFLNILKSKFVELSLDTVASHIVDVCWDSPMNYRQSIAEELMRAEPEMRESFSGRAVWRNWSMDKYKTRKQLWFSIGKDQDAAAASVTEKARGGQNKPGDRKKTAIELARERHAAQKTRGFGTGANAPSKRSAMELVAGEIPKKQRVQ